MMMVVEQPRVNVPLAQRRLDGRQVHGQTSIVNKSKDLSESGNWGCVKEESAGLQKGSCGDGRLRLSGRA
jgi:hypothetical protein